MDKLLKDAILYQTVHEKRETESWVISEKDLPIDRKRTLIGAHINIHDFYGNFPILVFNIAEKPKKGEVFRNVFLIDTETIPEKNDCFLANGIFLRECLPHEMHDEESGETFVLHTLDGIRLIFESADYREQISRLQKNKNCFVIGVHGADLVHFSRGFSDDLREAATPEK